MIFFKSFSYFGFDSALLVLIPFVSVALVIFTELGVLKNSFIQFGTGNFYNCFDNFLYL